ncbi:MAG: DUF6502 family protein [Geminicoccaceae bacterium]
MPEQGVTATLLHQALRRLLRPLVKGLISQGVIFPAMVELLRELYVDVAKNDFRVEGKEQTLSRLSLMTGVTRREIRRLIDAEPDDDAPPHALSLSARIMTIWLGDDAYIDGRGNPLPLPLTAEDEAPSLERLVASVSKDLRARAVLDEWLRLGVVDMSGYVIRLRKDAFIPDEGYEERTYYFGRNLRDHIAAGVHNLKGTKSPFLDRAVYYDRLSPSSLETLRQFTRSSGSKLMLRVNRKARQLADQDETEGGDLSGRMTFGVYYFSEEERDE